MIRVRFIPLLMCLLIIGCDKASKKCTIHLVPSGQLLADEMKVIFDADIRTFPECSSGTIVYMDMVGIRVETVTREEELGRITQSLTQIISNRGYGPCGTSWHEGSPDTVNLPTTEKRIVQIQELTSRGRDNGFDRHKLEMYLRYVNWTGGSLMSNEDIGNIVVPGGCLKDFAVLGFSSRSPYIITNGEQDVAPDG